MDNRRSENEVQIGCVNVRVRYHALVGQSGERSYDRSLARSPFAANDNQFPHSLKFPSEADTVGIAHHPMPSNWRAMPALLEVKLQNDRLC